MYPFVNKDTKLNMPTFNNDVFADTIIAHTTMNTGFIQVKESYKFNY